MKIEEFLGGSNKITQGLQLLLSISGLLVSLQTNIKDHPYLFGLAISLIVAGLLWLGLSYQWRRRKRKKISIAPPERTPSAYLRGLLPFETGEKLLGRTQDINRILTIIRNRDYRLIFISGEAGAGKTSLLRAGIIPGVQQNDIIPIYVSRTGKDPRMAILRTLKESGLSLREALNKAISEVLRQNPGKRLLIILDQFEECFVINNKREPRRELFSQIISWLADENLRENVKLLLCLRKEFVDDLLDLGDLSSDLINVRSRYPLRNWEPQTALEVLNAATEHDNIPFSDTLREELIRDLTQGGIVRPVELQLVATRLSDQGIYESEAYRSQGRARGILTSYIREIIAPSHTSTSEIDRQITKTFLRLLCADKGDTKRPTGLTFPEIRDRVKSQIEESDNGALMAGEDGFEIRLARNIEMCMKNYVVILEDEERYNLVNDYIVSAIRDATADIDPLEDRANRLLEQYAEERLHKPSATISFRHLRFIRKNASHSAKEQSEAAKLLVRSRNKITLQVTSFLFSSFLLAIAILPPHQSFQIDRIETFSNSDNWILSSDQQVAVSITKYKTDEAEHDPSQRYKSIIIWKLNEPWYKRNEVMADFTYVRVSRFGSYILGMNSKGELYLCNTKLEAGNAKGPILTRLDRDSPIDFGFSPNEKWAYALFSDGKVYIWNPIVGSQIEDSPFATLAPYKLAIRFSPSGEWVVLTDGDGNVYLEKPNAKTVNKLVPLSNIPVISIAERISIGEFSYDEKWFVVKATQKPLSQLPSIPFLGPDRPTQVEIINTLSREGTLLISPNKYGFYSDYSFTFSLNSDQLIAASAIGPFNVWNLKDPPNPDGKVALETDYESSGGFLDGSRDVRPPVYSPDGKWLAGTANDNRLYLWNTRGGSGREIQPLFPDSYDRTSATVTFSPNNKLIAALSPQGTVHIWKVENKPDPTAAATLAQKGSSIRFSQDSKSIIANDARFVLFGQVGTRLQEILNQPSDIELVDETFDGKELVVFCKDHISIVKRKWYLWGVPIINLSWPKLSTLIKEQG